jgi:hypothetical protein
MEPLSCVNCCHNPLQLGSIGTAFGHCTRHGVALVHPHATTCGQLLRKDLLIQSADRERRLHSKVYRTDRVSLVVAPEVDATYLTERPSEQVPTDAIVEEVQAYGAVDKKIATMAALRRISGPRAEVAMLSLSRAYVANCFRRDRKWKSSVHLLFWTLQRLHEEPVFAPTDLREPLSFSLSQTIPDKRDREVDSGRVPPRADRRCGCIRRQGKRSGGSSRKARDQRGGRCTAHRADEAPGMDRSEEELLVGTAFTRSLRQAPRRATRRRGRR